MGKSQSAPAPDPKLIDAQIKSLGIQDGAIQSMMSMSEDLAPLQKQQLQQTIDQSAQLWSQNQDDREFAIGKRSALSAVQDRIAAESNRFNEQDRRNQLAGQSDADVAQAFQVQRSAMDRDLARTGVNPNDGRSAAMKGQMAVSEALARVLGRKLAGDTARTERLQLDDRANNTLAGYPSMSMGAQGQGVATMGAGVQAINSGVQAMMSPYQSISGAAGQMGSNAASMYGTQANAYAQGQAADAQGMAGAGAAIGTIAIAI